MFGERRPGARLGLGPRPARSDRPRAPLLLALPVRGGPRRCARRPAGAAARVGPLSPARPRPVRSSSAPRSGSAASASWSCSRSSSRRRPRPRPLPAPPPGARPLRAARRPRLARRDRPAPGTLRGAGHARRPAAVARQPGSAPPRPVIVSAALFAAHPLRRRTASSSRSRSASSSGALRLRTGSLWPPVIAHVTLNALTFSIAPLVDDPARPYTPQPALGLACLAGRRRRRVAAAAGAARRSADSPRSAA